MRKRIIAALVVALATLGLTTSPASATDFSTDGWWLNATYSGPGPADEKWTYPDFPIRCNNNSADPAWKVIWVYNGADTTLGSTGLANVREGIARAMSIFAASAEVTFANPDKIGHTPRLVTYLSGNGKCYPSLAHENVESTSMLTDWYALKTELQRRGYNDPNRKYLVLVDQDNPGTGGQSDFNSDSRLTYDNGNNRGNTHSMAYAENYWATDMAIAIAHEMAHAMGAVSTDAPHSDGVAHTNEVYDLMNTGLLDKAGMIFNCNAEKYAARADCRRDDYFGRQDAFRSGARPAGYLATHWAVNDSRFMWTTYPTKPTP